MLRGHRDLKVFQLSYKLAVEIFHLSRAFPQVENHSLTNQIRRRPKALLRIWLKALEKDVTRKCLSTSFTDCDEKASETQVWIDFALDCGHMSKEDHDRLTSGYEEVGRMLSSMLANPEKFTLK